MNSDKPYVVIYLSDHGEYVNDEGDQIYGHGFKAISRGEIDIPLVFLFNDEYLKSIVRQLI
ncbi:sulfatase-like hydrolase/transferase [Candidatus Reidiella endopervernicosa]|uniref:sulfatase-like hydrolase/transferase n=1 Tax=Candidatus Reidiella endopervernicosa TaxID=2738883 RepID=UPI003B969182